MGNQEYVAVHEIKNAQLKCQRTITRAELMDKQMNAAQERKEKKQKEQEQNTTKIDKKNVSFTNLSGNGGNKSIARSRNGTFNTQSPNFTMDESAILTELDVSAEGRKHRHELYQQLN